MFQLMRLAALTGVAAVLVASAAAQGQSPLTQAVSTTLAQRAAYAFDLDVESSKQTWRTHFDPARPAPKLRLVSPSRDSLSGDARRAFDDLAEQVDGVSWCASERMGRVADVRLLRDEANIAVYAFQPTRESIRSETVQRYADRLRGEFTFAKASADISAVRIFLPEAFSPVPLMRIDVFSLTVTCASAPNGRFFAAETVTDVRGSAFGTDFNERSVQRAGNLRAAP